MSAWLVLGRVADLVTQALTHVAATPVRNAAAVVDCITAMHLHKFHVGY